ncbi:hypothetical protein BASA50_004172 [Batrachochytrium salamandrivorans]|uniref:F-box domain-containing protein n=1 Tax=Batrachochytrium salamandrivorans TaxID=1357716 RepID=A0ABQ8FJ34_9FUNG|nr:hypothetical protein BASA62_009428 [Batrachochytrium salamandrivorans]KAH6568367.1 hypothetical protein BASA60_008670 [Batrachochytrium salamandrivorans]KAH6597112.1 hypothetical protein BASA61_003247 [Batrachochytrium salamandrivorans]KAH6597827.1 hypothetical protein BASA50_004172 [Batrachochytrium salamandrivorans]KAH9269345.1 hypothetical protein BASA83_008570 [Batrachochytrium salamandrivorans]
MTRRTAATVSLEALAPEEIWRSIMMFVEDTDLHLLCKVCQLFRRFSTDLVLWRKLVHERNPERLEMQLTQPQRPSRVDLAIRGILRASSSPETLARHIQEGRYVNGPLGVQTFQAGQVVKRTFTRSALGRLLVGRPDVAELCHRGVFPIEVGGPIYTATASTLVAVAAAGSRSISPRLFPRMAALRSALRRDKLKRSLQSCRSMGKPNESTFGKLYGPNSPLLQTLAMLTKHFAELQLQHKLRHRPNVEAMELRKVLRSGVHIAHMICPSIRPKVAFYESLSIVG